MIISLLYGATAAMGGILLMFGFVGLLVLRRRREIDISLAVAAAGTIMLCVARPTLGGQL